MGLRNLILEGCAFLTLACGASFPDGIAQTKNPNLPFQLGETLTYRIKWNPPAWLFILPGTYHAGEITLTAAEQINHEAHPAFKFKLQATSSGILPKLVGFKVEDYAESISDAQELCSYQVTKRIREGKRKRDVFVKFQRKERKIHITEMDVSGDQPKEKKNEIVNEVPGCVYDIIAAFYAIRLHNLAVGDSFRMPVSDEGPVKDVQVKVLSKERINALGRVIPALRVEALGVFGGLFRTKGNFFVWLSDDEKKMPVKFEAKVKYGKIQGTLISSLEANEMIPSSNSVDYRHCIRHSTFQ